jgi:hypothetical protein
VTCAGLVLGSGAPAASPIDELLGSCPPAAELAAIDAELALTFDADPTAGVIACTAAAGSRDLTPLEKDAYAALRAMKALGFSRPLPWTPKTLYQWFVDTADGIRFRDDVEFSSCCSPARVVNITLRGQAWLGKPWVAFDTSGGGLWALVHLLVHEARHIEVGGHTCGYRDRTIAELGAVGVTYWLALWDALYSGGVLTGPDVYPPYYREYHLTVADAQTRSYCELPTSDVALSASSVLSGPRVAETLTVRNEGPDPAPQVFLYRDVDPGAVVAGAVASQGSCAAPPAVGAAVVACDLGPLAVGAAATVAVTLDPPGTPFSPGFLPFALSRGAWAGGPFVDPNPANHQPFSPFVDPAGRPVAGGGGGQALDVTGVRIVGGFRESRFRGALEVAGSVLVPTEIRVQLLRLRQPPDTADLPAARATQGATCRVAHTCRLPVDAGSFSRSLPLATTLDPGTYRVFVGASGAAGKAFTLVLAPPREGTVWRAWASSRRDGGAARVRAGRPELWAHFLFQTVPATGRVTIGWRSPSGRTYTVRERTRLRVDSRLRVPGGLEQGTWQAVLRASGKVVWRLPVRVV